MFEPTIDAFVTAPLLPLPKSMHRTPGVFWSPNEAFLQDLADRLHEKSVLEIFSGNGYLAGLLTDRGVSVTATSILSGMDAHANGVYHPVAAMDAVSAVSAFGLTHDVLLVCWPTVTDAVLRSVRAWGPGRDIVFIGEFTDYEQGHLGGCATDAFFEAISVIDDFPSYRGNMMERAVVCRLSPDAATCAPPTLVNRDPRAAADALELLNLSTNDGRGSSVCRAVISELRRNDVEGAKLLASFDFDKVRQYPEMAKLFGTIGLIPQKLR
jgi:hypothetical protein